MLRVAAMHGCTQVKEHLGTWESAQWDAEEEAVEEEELRAARAALNATQAAVNATRAAAAAASGDGGDTAAAADAQEDAQPDSSSSNVEAEVSPALQEELRERQQAVDDLVATRKAREVKAVAAAYWAATQVRDEGGVGCAHVVR
jgi:hypothetical protein